VLLEVGVVSGHLLVSILVKLRVETLTPMKMSPRSKVPWIKLPEKTLENMILTNSSPTKISVFILCFTDIFYFSEIYLHIGHYESVCKLRQKCQLKYYVFYYKITGIIVNGDKCLA